MKYVINEGATDIPGMIDDKTVNFFIVKEPSAGDEMSFVITRSSLRAGETLEKSVSNQLSIMSRQVQAFTEKKRYEIVVGEKSIPGIAIEADHMQGTVKIHQILAAFLVDEEHMLVYALSGRRPIEEANRRYWEHIVSSFQLAE